MKNTIQLFILIVPMLLMSSYCFSQKQTLSKDISIEPQHEYKNAIGIRAGSTAGITFKHFMNTGNAFEAILGIWPNAIGFTGLYEKHTGTGLNGLKFYYGGGAHFTGETGNYYYRTHRAGIKDYEYRYGLNGFGVGVDGVVGIDYKIGVVPLAVSFDLKPYVEVSNYGTLFTALDAGLGIKIAF